MTLNSELIYCILENEEVTESTNGIVKLTSKKKTNFLPFLDLQVFLTICLIENLS